MAMESVRQCILAQTDGNRRDLKFTMGDQLPLKSYQSGTATLPSKKLFPSVCGKCQLR